MSASSSAPVGEETTIKPLQQGRLPPIQSPQQQQQLNMAAPPANVPLPATYSVPAYATHGAPNPFPTVVTPIQTAPGPPKPGATRPGWAHNSAVRLGCIQVIAGIILFIINIIGLLLQKDGGLFYGFTGFWGGIYMIIMGGIGIAAGKRKTTGFIITWMVLTIVFAVVFAVAIVTVHGIGVTMEAVKYDEGSYRDDYVERMPSPEYPDYGKDGCYHEYLDRYNCTHHLEWKNDIYCEFYNYSDGTNYTLAKKRVCPIDYDDFIPTAPPKTSRMSAHILPHVEPEHRDNTGLIVLHAMALILGLAIFICAIVSSGLTCRAICCRRTSPRIQVVYVPTGGNLQFVPISDGRMMAVSVPQQQMVPTMQQHHMVPTMPQQQMISTMHHQQMMMVPSMPAPQEVDLGDGMVMRQNQPAGASLPQNCPPMATGNQQPPPYMEKEQPI